MSIQSSVDKSVNLVYLLANDAVLQPLSEFWKLWQLTYITNKLKAVIILFTVFFVIVISCFLSYKVFIERNLAPVQAITHQNNYSSGGIGGVVNGKDSSTQDGRERAVAMYLESYNGFFTYIGDFFEDYISNTVDPLGHSTTDGSGVSFEPVVNKNSKIKFSTDTTTFYSAYRYASILIGIVTPILVLMVVITGLQVLMSQNNQYTFEKLTQKLTRICSTVALIFVGMPLLLTSSIMTTNLLNKLILSSGGATCPVEVGKPPSTKKDLTCFITTISKKIKNDEIKENNNQPRTVEIDGWDIGSMLKVQGQNFGGFLLIAPIILITLFMLILLFVVFVQFVIRYLQIYFLFTIYPIVAVLWYNQSTSKYFSEYWKQLVTLLIQQPVFLLCFVIFGDISISLMQDLKPSNILLFCIYLVFLVTVPQALTARIFGDVFAYQSSQDFSDKVNYIGNKAHSGFNSVKQKGEQMVSSGIKNTPKAFIKGTGLAISRVSAAANKFNNTETNSGSDKPNKTSNSKPTANAANDKNLQETYSNVQYQTQKSLKSTPTDLEKSIAAGKKRKTLNQKISN